VRVGRIVAVLLTACSFTFFSSIQAIPGHPAGSQDSGYAASNRVTVHVLGLFHPNELVVSAEPRHPLYGVTGSQGVAIGDSLCGQATLRRDGKQVSLRCGEFRIAAPQIRFSARDGDAEFFVSVPGKLVRPYRGELAVTANNNELIAVVEMDLETAVASVVAAEMPADSPFEALKAQAVVTRSFLAASAPRHSEANFCDTTHCEFLRSPPPPASRAARAANATKGLLLTWQGEPFSAMYSASCTGKTRSLEQAGYRQHDYPYFAVECAYCLRHPQSGGTLGHGIGLCQRGASGMAQDGADFRTILAHYFPNTEIRTGKSEPHVPQNSF
jgi:hypothetical protein